MDTTPLNLLNILTANAKNCNVFPQENIHVLVNHKQEALMMF